MQFRSHLGRPMDFSLWSNRVIAAFFGIGLVAGGAVALTIGPTSAWLTPLYVGAAWTLGREIDPDHDWPALVAALGAGGWALAGFDTGAVFATFGLMLAARIVVSTTGRRPLLTDYIFVGVVATVMSYTIVGWAAGFAIALAIYIDDRMAEEQRPMAVVSAAITALAASGVATAAQAFPQEVPDVRSVLVISVGLVALIAIAREPEPPVALVDSRRKTQLEVSRLYAGRSLVAVMVFLAAFLSGAEAELIIPAAFTVLLALVSNEVERVRRRGG